MSNILLRNSERYKNRANYLLKKTGIKKILKKYGDVYEVGGYALNCMTRPDIDINIIIPGLTQKDALNFFKQISNKKWAHKIEYFNAIKHKIDNGRGHWFGIYTKEEEFGVWRIDIWLMPKSELLKIKKTKKALQLLDEQVREKVIERKSKALKQGKRLNTIEALEQVLKIKL